MAGLESELKLYISFMIHTHPSTPTQKRYTKVENRGTIKGMLGKWDGIINSRQNRIQGLNN